MRKRYLVVLSNIAILFLSGCSPKIANQAFHCHPQDVQKEIDKGSPLYTQDYEKFNTLRSASLGHIAHQDDSSYAQKCLQTIDILLKNGARIDSVTTTETALFLAAWYNDPALAKFLLEKGADVNKGDITGYAFRTPLFATVNSNAIEVAKILLEYGADTSVVNANGQTPAQFARSKGKYELAKLISTYKSTSSQIQRK